MNNKSVRKLTIAGLLVAVAVVGSLFSIPVLGSKCSPVQHMVNVLAAVLLGPWYACGMGFAAALLRNLLGLGSLPGVSRLDDRRTAVRPAVSRVAQAARLPMRARCLARAFWAAWRPIRSQRC